MRYFVGERQMELMVTQSYSKNFGLYGERIGAPARPSSPLRRPSSPFASERDAMMNLVRAFPLRVPMPPGLCAALSHAPPPPPSRTKWTRLVHPSVLIGHVPRLTLGASAAGALNVVVSDAETATKVRPNFNHLNLTPCTEPCALSRSRSRLGA